MPKVSVITPCYNASRYVGRTIDSVRQQSFGDWEHVVVDDGSSDTSASSVREIAAIEPRLRLVCYPNGGCALARNRGFANARSQSRYLMFLDADDLLETNALDVMISYMDANPNVGLAYCDFCIVDSNDGLIEADPFQAGWAPRYAATRYGVRQVPQNEPETPLESIFAITAIIPSVCIFRRSIFEMTPGWDEEMGVIYEDVSLYLNMALRSKVHFVPQKLVRYRRHASQSSQVCPETFNRQAHRLYIKWMDVPGLTNEQRAVIRAAQRFREGPLAFYLGIRTGNRRLRSGEFYWAIRFYAGAMRRYLACSLRPRAWHRIR